jgi:peptidyl-prolyl cis-trans isomerase D
MFAFFIVFLTLWGCMFDFIRQHTKIMQFLLFLLIFPSFVLFGIDGYNRFLDQGETVASVDGQKINQPEWDNAHKNEVERMRASMPNLDVKMFDSPMAKFATLEKLVKQKVLSVASDKLNLQVSDQRLASALAADPTIASLKRADGTLDMERYQGLLASQGMSPEQFESRMRVDLAMQQVLMGVSASATSNNAMIETALNAYYEKREAQVIKFTPSEQLGQIKSSTEDLQAYYKAHSALFQSPEQASIEYVVLDMPSVLKGITLAESDLKTYYEQNQSKLSGQETRRVSHILFTIASGQPSAEKDKVKQKAQGVLDELKKSPEKFASLAKQYSQDPGSANKGGDLDFFGRGAMVKPFEDVAFSLSKGQTSDLVETDFGYHIIKVTDIKSPKTVSFEASRAGIEAEVKRQEGQKKFAELAETFTNLVYEQPDSLKPAADKLKLDIVSVNDVKRDPSPVANGQPSWIKNPKFLAAIFAADAIEKKHNTQAVEVGSNTLVAARIREYQPARVREFEAVKAQVEILWKKEKSEQLAKQMGEQKLKAWREKPESANLPSAVTISREKSKEWSSKLIEAVLRAPATSLPVWVGVDLGAEGYAVVKILKVDPSDAMAGDRSREKSQLTAWLSDAESAAYYDYLKDRFKATIKKANPLEPLVGQK